MRNETENMICARALFRTVTVGCGLCLCGSGLVVYKYARVTFCGRSVCCALLCDIMISLELCPSRQGQSDCGQDYDYGGIMQHEVEAN